MKKLILLFGLVLLAGAGTAAAQTSVELSLGFGTPRPYMAGDVFIGGSFFEPVYRPYYYYYPDRYPYYFYRPLPVFYGPPRRVFIYERAHRFYRRDLDRRFFVRGDFDRDWDRDRHWRRGDDRGWRHRDHEHDDDDR